MPLKTVRSLLAVALLSVTFAGCLGDDPTADDAAIIESIATRLDMDPGIGPSLGLGGAALSSTVSTGAEPHVIVDDAGGFILVGDWKGIRRSTNGGATWQSATPSNFGALLADGWALAQDADGAVYAAGLAPARLNVYKSTNGGASYNPVGIIPSSVSVIPDRPWIAARESGELVLTWNDSGVTQHCQKSYDGGTTWTDQKPVAGGPIAGNVVFGEDGTIYYANQGATLYRIRPDNVPYQLGLPTHCLLSAGSYNMYPWNEGETGQIQVATEDGAAYIAVPTSGNVAMAVTGTQTFTGLPTAVTVSPPELQSNTFGTIDIQDGRIAVSWLGSTTPGNPNTASFAGSWHVYVATIDDFWTTPVVTVYQVTTVPNHVGDICMNGIGCGGSSDRDLLDYMDIDFDAAGNIHVVYTHDGNTSATTVIYALVTPS